MNKQTKKMVLEIAEAVIKNLNLDVEVQVPINQKEDPKPPNHGSQWHPYEESLLKCAFSTFIQDAARAHKRTDEAIICKLSRLYPNVFKRRK